MYIFLNGGNRISIASCRYIINLLLFQIYFLIVMNGERRWSHEKQTRRKC